MTKTHLDNATKTATQYEAPSLALVGPAIDVVLGPPGMGYDGPYGFSEPQFEFEAEEE